MKFLPKNAENKGGVPGAKQARLEAMKTYQSGNLKGEKRSFEKAQKKPW
jgi:hypothetical protein